MRPRPSIRGQLPIQFSLSVIRLDEGVQKGDFEDEGINQGGMGKSSGEAHQMPLHGMREIGVLVPREIHGYPILINDIIPGFGPLRTKRGQSPRADRREVYIEGADINVFLWQDIEVD